MAERASIFQIVQVGAESTPGTAVAATKRLGAMQLAMGAKVDISKYRPSGNKWNTIAALNREWTEGKLSGPVTYSEIVYALAGVLEKVSPTGSTAKTWTFAPNATTADVRQSFTIEQGSSVRAHRIAYGLITALGLKFKSVGVELDGTVLGQALEDNHALTSAGVTDIPLVPVLPTQVQIYLADTAAGLDAAGALERAISAEWSIGDRFGAAYFLDGTASWATDVETEPSLSTKLLMEADAAGMALLATMRAGATKFLRILAEGAEIESGTNYTLQIDTACKITDVSEFSDEDGIFAIEWTMDGFYDATWGRVTEVTVINQVAAL